VGGDDDGRSLEDRVPQQQKTTEKQIRAWFAQHGWRLEPGELRAALQERGASDDLTIELIDDGAELRRAAVQPPRSANGRAPVPPPGGQVAPQNLEAEEHVLGAMMIAPAAIARARDVLGDTGSDFYRESHATIYQVALEISDAGVAVDPVTLQAALQERGLLDRVGGRVRLHELAAIVPATANTAHYARIVHETATLRWIQRLAMEAGRRVHEHPGAASDLVDEIRLQVGELEQRVTPADDIHLHSGGDFILDTPSTDTAVWGTTDGQIGWASGEGLVLAGPQGVGKTTLAQQLALAGCGLLSQILGMPVTTAEKRTLYIAADRPRQAARSLARMVDEHNRADLNDRLQVWAGPLPFLLSDQPTGLVRLCQRLDIGRVFIDSIKDVIGKPSDEEHANRFNMAIQHCLAADIEVCALHHQRKEQQGAGKPKHLADVYGNTFLTAGMGSVILLWGDPGDPIVELRHLKQPNDEIGPWDIRHNHDRGITLREQAPDIYELLTRAGGSGLTAQVAAGMLRQTDTPSKSEIEKARRQLLRLVEQGHAREEAGIRGDHYNPTRFLPRDESVTA
jgi:replicative DNA helicase